MSLSPRACPKFVSEQNITQQSCLLSASPLLQVSFVQVQCPVSRPGPRQCCVVATIHDCAAAASVCRYPHQLGSVCVYSIQ